MIKFIKNKKKRKNKNRKYAHASKRPYEQGGCIATECNITAASCAPVGPKNSFCVMLCVQCVRVRESSAPGRCVCVRPLDLLSHSRVSAGPGRPCARRLPRQGSRGAPAATRQGRRETGFRRVGRASEPQQPSPACCR